MPKLIILFGAGKSASVLIKFLVNICEQYAWLLTVADNNLELAQSKIGLSNNAKAREIHVQNQQQRSDLIREADLVISLLPPALHILVAEDCLWHGKNLLTASYVDNAIKALSGDIKKKGLLFLCEMGLDPGIDHMSAMQLIEKIKAKGGEINSFRSHCGGLLAPESDDNPWHYKISWNPGNIVRAGSGGAIFRENNETKQICYEKLFHECRELEISGEGRFAYYPNRDSLPYIHLYHLENTSTFVRTTLRNPDFCHAWGSIVSAGLTDDKIPVSTDLTFAQWSRNMLPLVDSRNKEQLEYIGLFGHDKVPPGMQTSADILQYLLEKNLMMQQHDKDMVIMLHEIEYKLDGILHKATSLFSLKGENNVNTAMAKTVGLPLGIAAMLILHNKINLTGLHIPIKPEIYNPVMKELKQLGINFEEDELN